MRATLITEIGWCGFGRYSGMLPGVRLGVVQFYWCRGAFSERIDGWLAALKTAQTELARWRGASAGLRIMLARVSGRSDDDATRSAE